LAWALLFIAGVLDMARCETNQSMRFHEILNGGIVNNVEVATKIAELVVSNAYGPLELERQKPFKVIDLKDRWRIEGSYNVDHSIEGPDPVELVIAKRDAQIYELSLPQIMLISPEVTKLLDENKLRDK
jgi:hypothetical protein